MLLGDRTEPVYMNDRKVPGMKGPSILPFSTSSWMYLSITSGFCADDSMFLVAATIRADPSTPMGNPRSMPCTMKWAKSWSGCDFSLCIQAFSRSGVVILDRQ